MRGRGTVLVATSVVLVLVAPAAAEPGAITSAGGRPPPPPPQAVATAATDTACAGAPRSGFADVSDATAHHAAIACLAWWRIAGGFPDGRFRPGQAVTRGQVATLLTATVLGVDGPLPPPGSGFPDTRGTTHGRPVARLADAGLVGGYPDGRFRPGAAVTRGQVASLLARTLEHLDVPAPRGTPSFTDTSGSVHAEAIGVLAGHGVATGFADGTFRPDQPVTRGQVAALVARSLELVVVTTGVAVRAAWAAVDQGALTAAVCPTTDSDMARADRVLAGHYRLPPHPEVHLGTRLTWTEDPLGDANWRFQLHALRWLWPLVAAAEETGEVRYRDHAMRLAASWVATNPRDAPVSAMAWNDHSTAWRTRVLTCLARHGPTPPWLEQALRDHVAALADPSFYVHRGNHALNQDGGMLAAACHTHAWDARDLAIERIDHLVRTGVDAQGVVDEQAVEYQAYNLRQYLDRLELIAACGRAPPASSERIVRMPEVLAHMTLPDGTYETLGDTERRTIGAVDHPAVRWVRSGGRDGAPPADRFVVYAAGFAFARSGWGETRPLVEETMASVRFGPPRTLHGHDDHGSVSLYAQGRRLLTNPGKYRYGSAPERAHVLAAEAHNVVTFGAGCGGPVAAPSTVSAVASDATTDRLRVHVATCPGTSWVRHVAFVRDEGIVVVVDELAGPRTAAKVQRWQLDHDAVLSRVGPSGAHARWPDGATLAIDQLQPVASASAVAGGRDPLRGWLSPRYGDWVPAPNLAFTAPTGSTATLVTVLRPGAAADAPRSSVERADGAWRVSVPTGDRTIEVSLGR
jgi:hypothetical protein